MLFENWSFSMFKWKKTEHFHHDVYVQTRVFFICDPYTTNYNNTDNTKSLLNYCEQCNLVMPMIFTQIIDRVKKREWNWICQRNDVAGKNEHRMEKRTKNQMNQQITIILHWNPWETFSHGYFLGVFFVVVCMKSFECSCRYPYGPVRLLMNALIILLHVWRLKRRGRWYVYTC